MNNEQRIWAGVCIGMILVIVAALVIPQIDTRSDLERASDNLNESMKKLESLY